MPLPTAIGESEAFEKLYALLRAIAGGQATDRSEAVSYSTWRDALLKTGRPELLPGFLQQCLSVARFRDFITLYDPDPAERERFVRTAFELTRDRLDLRGGFDAPSVSESESEWSF